MPPIAEGTRLVIVESPAKAKTITKYLGPGYAVRASMGHVRDLPDRGIGIDIEHDFAPTYVVTDDKTDTVKQLKSAVKSASAVYLATDPDREGEAIAWHLVKATTPTRDKPVHRVIFHEITQDAVRAAIANPREIDMHLVDAQQARRVLDRLVGYQLTPFLWKKVTRGLSAGRVQSVALRLVVEREREIHAFVPVESWTVEADFAKITGQERTPRDLFHARLTQINGKKADLKVQGDAQAVLDGLTGAGYAVKDVNKTERKRNAAPPFTTSTLQQEASRKHGYAVANTMRIAQQLYEGVDLSSKEGEVGLITYMRTDSLNISDEAREAARRLIVSRYGGDFYPTKPNFYRTKAKGAQEAHEAIRPTDPARTPEDVRPYLSPQQFNVYRLIWQRFVASQMAQAVFDVTQVDILGTPNAERHRVHLPRERLGDPLPRLPGSLPRGARRGRRGRRDRQGRPARRSSPDEPRRPRQPRARAALDAAAAPLHRGVARQGAGGAGHRPPEHLRANDRDDPQPQLCDEGRESARAERIGHDCHRCARQELRRISSITASPRRWRSGWTRSRRARRAWVPLLHQFYGPFDANAKKAEADGGAVKGEQTDEICEVCGKPMVIRVSRYGRFLSCSGYPECKNTRPLDGSGAPPQYEKVPDEPTDDICPTCGKPMVVKTGRYGRFIACVDYPTCKTSKKIEVTTGVHCPQCATGELVQRKTRKGNRVFWGCNRYPDCDYTTNTDPRKVAPAPVAMLAD